MVEIDDERVGRDRGVKRRAAADARHVQARHPARVGLRGHDVIETVAQRIRL